MKQILVISMLLLISNGVCAVSKVQLTNGRVYVAHGFDDNDFVEVIVSGSMPNLCYKQLSYEVSKVKNKFIISLYANVYKDPAGCREIALPYFEAINLGSLAKGQYQIELKETNNPQAKATLEVMAAHSPVQDDFLYGNVMFVEENDSDRWIEIKGINPVNCLEFDRLESEIQSSVIVLRPVFKEKGNCDLRPTPFSLKYEVPYLSGHPRGLLLHVRTMNGKSYNYLYEGRFE